MTNLIFCTSDARDLLRVWREDVVRRSDDVIDIWEAFLKDSSQLGDEKWMIIEQVTIQMKSVKNRYLI